MSNFADTFHAAGSGLEAVHRRVVRVGAFSAWFAGILFIAIGLVAGVDDLFVQAVAPILAGAVMTAQVLMGRENGAVALLVSAIVVMAAHALIGGDDTMLSAAVALVIICALAMVFVQTKVPLVVPAVGAFLFAVPLLWGIPLSEAVVLGSVMALSFVVTTVIFVTVRSVMTGLHARFQMLFEHSPAAVTEEDWSAALAYVRSVYTGQPGNLESFLLAYPAVVKRAVSRAKVVRVNRAAVELHEADGPGDLLGHRRVERLPEATLEALAGGLVALYEGRGEFEQEVYARTLKGRPIWLQARAVDTSPDLTGTRIIVGQADITHVKERSEAMSELVRAKDEFIARVSHELRTPLTAVVGLTSEMTEAGPMSAEEQAELLAMVAGQAAEMSYIVEDLLVVARAEMGTVAIDTTAVDLCDEIRVTVGGLGIDVAETPRDAGEALADPSRVRQILRNLLTNADRYGGPKIRVLAGETAETVWLEVRDDGEGVEAAMADGIFDSYATAHGGTHAESVGLGLSVARQLAEMMDGSLRYRRDGAETVFRLELPTATGSERELATNIVSA